MLIVHYQCPISGTTTEVYNCTVYNAYCTRGHRDVQKYSYLAQSFELFEYKVIFCSACAHCSLLQVPKLVQA